MEAFSIHLIKSSVFLMVAYCIYLCLVRVTTFHYLNRGFLLLTLGISLILPFFHFPVEENHIVYAYTLPTIEISHAPVFVSEEPSYGLENGLTLLYALVSIALALRLVFHLFSLMTMLSKHPKQITEGFKLIYSNTTDSAFSFFRYIVLPANLSIKDELIILEHEKQHAQRWHSIDVLLMEFIKVFFWFHPVVYLLKHELIQQHEFEIDRLLTTQNAPKTPKTETTHKIDIEQYGNLLIQQAQQIPVQMSLTNNFNHSLIKNRIQMMTKQKSKKIQLFRYVLLVPLLGLICTMIACEKRIANNSTATTGLPAIVEIMPEFPGGELALLKHFGSNIKYPEAARLADIEGVVVLEFIVEKDGSITDIEILRDIGGGCGEEALRIAKEMPKWKPGMDGGKLARVVYKLPVRFKLNGEEENTNTAIQQSATEHPLSNVEKVPKFPGGEEALLKFYGSNIIYPEAAKTKKVEGIVVLGFVIEKDGSVTNLEIIRDIGGGCGKEALRIAKQMPNWSPGLEKGKPVRVAYKFPVRFQLDSNSRIR